MTDHYYDTNLARKKTVPYSERKKRAYPAVREAYERGDIDTILERLTGKQRRFCEEYLVDYNASAAIMRAGYKSTNPNNLASDMLKKEHIRMAIDALALQKEDQTTVSVEYVIRKIVRQLEKAEENNQPQHVLRAAELLAKHLNMFKETVEVSGKDGDPIQYEKIQNDAADFARSIAGIASRGGKNSDIIEAIPSGEGGS